MGIGTSSNRSDNNISESRNTNNNTDDINIISSEVSTENREDLLNAIYTQNDSMLLGYRSEPPVIISLYYLYL
jgi:hypothetical protein